MDIENIYTLHQSSLVMNDGMARNDRVGNGELLME